MHRRFGVDRDEETDRKRDETTEVDSWPRLRDPRDGHNRFGQKKSLNLELGLSE